MQRSMDTGYEARPSSACTRVILYKAIEGLASRRRVGLFKQQDHPLMDLQVINSRIDQALAGNKRAELIIVGMAVSIFLVGLAVIVVAYWLKNPYVASGSMLMQGLLAFPINEVRKLRRDNLILQTFPVLIVGLPPDKAAAEIRTLLAHLRGIKR